MENVNLKQEGNNANTLLYADIKIGMEVMDKHGDIGVVTECDDPHNVLVEYGNGGKEGSEDGTDNLYICV